MAGRIERGVGRPWAERARAVQARIRDRLRVVAHRHWRPDPGGSSGAAALRRWALRVRSLWNDPHSGASSSLPSSSSSSSSFRFYRKKVDKDVDAIDDSVIVRMLQALAVPIIGNACHVFMHGLNYVQVCGAEKLHQALLERPKGKPLVTVSNHVAAVDDPFVIASLIPPSVMLDAQNLRWTMCATDRCFTNPFLSAFFRCVKVLPVSRGDGIYQKGMDMALIKLNNGGWVHIFPEGSRSKDGGKTIAPAKRGVGRLVMDADSIPIVIPFVHTGMQDIMPVGIHFPKTGKRVIVIVGDPINFDDLLVNNNDSQNISRGILYDEATTRIGQRLQELKAEVDRLAQEQSLELHNCCMHKDENGYLLWQQVDWEAFGIGSSMSSAEPLEVVGEQPKQSASHPEPPSGQNTSQTAAPASYYDSGIVSQVRGYMDPAELMGFAARGLFRNGRFLEESRRELRESGTWHAWKGFLNGNVLPQWNSI